VAACLIAYLLYGAGAAHAASFIINSVVDTPDAILDGFALM